MIGKTISHYRVLQLLGRGGMGEVYLAEDVRLGRKVALKFLAPELTHDPDALSRFKQEALAVANVTHSNIAVLHDIGEQEGKHFLVFEYVQGQTVLERLKSGPLTFEEILSLGRMLATGLAHAHAYGIIHRDIKASNLMLTSEGELKILDFGLSRRAEATRVTMPGIVMGTVSYMSPEQAAGEEADERSDIWSLGVVLYECLTGRPPFRGQSTEIILDQIRRGSPPPLSELREDTPPALMSVIEKCLAKDPTHRYQDAATLSRQILALERSLGLDPGLVDGELPTATVRRDVPPRKRTTRTRSLFVVGAVATVAVLTTFITLKLKTKEPEPLPTPSQTALTIMPNWIVVGDFIGPTDDPELAQGARQFVVASLEQSGVAFPVPRSQLLRGLEIIGRSDTTRIRGALAAELAYRSSSQVYLEGRIDRLMSGFSIALRVFETENRKLIASKTSVAESSEEFIPTLISLANEIAGALAQRLDVIQPKRPQYEILTPSLAALRSFTRAWRLFDKNQQVAAIPLLQETLQHDQDFGAAWLLLSLAYLVAGETDSCQAALEEGLKRPERLSEGARFYGQSMVALLEWDLEEALRLRTLAFEAQPFHAHICHDLGSLQYRMGHYEEALQSFSRAVELHPIDPSLFLDSQVCTLFLLGRFHEAEEVAQNLDGNFKEMALLGTRVALGRWAAAESLATVYENGASVSNPTRCAAAMTRASILAVRGSLREAFRHMERAQTVSDDCGPQYFVSGRPISAMCVTQAQLVWVSGVEADPCEVAEPVDLPIPILCENGLVAIAQGDRPLAQQYFDLMRHRDSIEQRQHDFSVRLLEAYLDAYDENWEPLIERLAPIVQSNVNGFERYKTCMRWLLASAYMETGDLQSAAEHFELIVEPKEFFSRHDTWMLPLHHAFARQRLVILYAKLGRLEDARHHWERFQEIFTHPDPELIPLMEEAREALSNART